MKNEIYKPPQSDLLPENKIRLQQFYVVSKVKASVLFISTIGLYVLFWFFLNWRFYKNYTGEKIMPIARTFFFYFFTHSLFNNVNYVLDQNKIEYKWSPKILATLFIVVYIASNILDRLSVRGVGSPLTDILSIAVLPIILFILLKAQGAINISQGDPLGVSNAKFTIYNYLWIFFGGIFWVLMVIGLLDVFGLVSIET